MSSQEYFRYHENSIPKAYGYCSDRNCPCPETKIARGSGYLYISREAVDFMKKKMSGAFNGGVVFGPMPVLVCEEGAKLRGIDLEVASEDAKLWWETGKAPLRPTPMAK